MDQGTPPLPGLFSGVKKVIVNDGDFVHVENDYHVHGNMTTHVHNASLTPASAPQGGAKKDTIPLSVSSIQIGGDQHVHGDYHVHYHYPEKNSRDVRINVAHRNIRVEVASADPSVQPHYHVYIGGELSFCTLFSSIYRSRHFPVFPSVEAVKRYALTLFAEINTGMYYEDFRRRYRPEWSFRYFNRYYLKQQHEKYVYIPYETPPTRDLKLYTPPFNFDEYLEKERMYLYSLPCMHGAHVNPASDTNFSPKGALFSHLDHSGVK